jgi:hypothetical protein
MGKKWMPTVAGSLNIIAASISLLAVVGLVLSVFVISGVLGFVGIAHALPLNITGLLWILIVYFFISGALAMLGGFYALQRKNWVIALLGSVAAFFSSGVLGMASIVFTALGKESFD